MAVNKTINKRTNTHGAMRNCIEYVLRQDKTSEQLAYVTGPYLHEEMNYDLVYRTFLEEKKLWNKDSGRMYAHNIISWHKDEQITQEQAFEFGKEFAENWFGGFQTLVAVHKDKDHIHCHLVINSVSYEDGRKLHNTKKDLERMKQLTNQMCRERGLTVAEKGKHFDGSQIEKGEVIAWSKDKYNLFRQQVKDSFVADCAMAVLKAMENCISKEKFIEKMKQFGWSVNWTEKRKHITFQNQDGKKVRDSNLSKTFHLDICKEGLENEFNGNYERIRAEAERTAGADEELTGYYRQVEAACEGTGRNAGESDGRAGRVAGEKSEDERVYTGIPGKDTHLRNRNGLMSRSEQELLEEEIKDVRDWNSKLQVQVNKSSVEAVDQAQQRQEEAEKQAKQAVAQVEREKKRADVEIQRANLNAKRQMDILKEKEYFWGAGYVTIILFSILKSSAFQRDLLDFFRVPIRWYCRFIEWLVIPTYDDGFGNQVAYQAGEAWLFRILALALFIIIGVISVLYIIEGIQIYKKQWDDISKLCFLSSLAGIVVLGDIIREWLPVNLLIIFLLINIAMMVLKMWMKKSFRSRK